MNRELRFRAWNKQTKKMIDIHATTPLALDIDPLIAKGAGMGVYIPDHPDLIIEQYTGLKDKNGVEIYAGDKISFTVFDHNDYDTQYEGIVKFAHGEWQIWNTSDSEYYGADGAFSLFWVHPQDEELEIIGNIHTEAE